MEINLSHIRDNMNNNTYDLTNDPFADRIYEQYVRNNNEYNRTHGNIILSGEYGMKTYYHLRESYRDKTLQFVNIQNIQDIINRYPTISNMNDSEVVLYATSQHNIKSDLLKSIQWAFDQGAKLIHIALVMTSDDDQYINMLTEFNEMKQYVDICKDRHELAMKYMKAFFGIDSTSETYIRAEIPYVCTYIDMKIFDKDGVLMT